MGKVYGFTHKSFNINASSLRDDVHIAIELLDGAVLLFTVEIPEQHSFVRKQFACLLAVALGNTFHKLYRRLFNSLIFLKL